MIKVEKLRNKVKHFQEKLDETLKNVGDKVQNECAVI